MKALQWPSDSFGIKINLIGLTHQPFTAWSLGFLACLSQCLPHMLSHSPTYFRITSGAY